MSRLAKYLLIGAAILVIVGTTVGVVLSIQKDAPKTSADKLNELRRLMKEHNVDAYIIPSVDAHQSEYISYRDRRISYISDFTGSAGEIYVTANAAALWTDSRYHIQADEQLDTTLWTIMKTGLPQTPSPVEWLPAQIRVGIDPYLIDAERFRTLSASLQRRGNTLVEVTPNLVDLVWSDKPQQQLPPIEPWDFQFSGQRVVDKVAALRAVITERGATAAVVSALDDVAWLLNLRGRDIQNNPVFYAYVLVTASTVDLYVLDPHRINGTIESHFEREGIAVTANAYEGLTAGIRGVLQAATNATVLLSRPNQALFSAVPVDQQVLIASPVNRMKVVKNDVEAAGMRRAHIVDGVAVIKYLHWLNGSIDAVRVTELSGAAELGRFRAQGELFQGLSFGAISAVGPHAAMAHYSPTAETDRQITRTEIYLIDSGGQYSDGTTDITRTVHFGRPTEAERDSFTRVLKGFISLSRAVFPVGADPSFFDAMARRALWDAGLDYGHGTGHGVGAYLNVHEYPPLLSRRNDPVGILQNMFTSNEPGYYEAGEYGIRIEDVVQVVRADETTLRGNFGGLGALTFFDCTMAPIQTTLIREEMLTADEARWLNDFHARVREGTRALLSAVEYEWLVQQTPNVTFGAQCSESCAAQCSVV